MAFASTPKYTSAVTTVQSAETAQAAHESWGHHYDAVWAASDAARAAAAPPETSAARLDASWASPSDPARAGLSHARRQPLTTRSVVNDFRRPNRRREFCPSQHPTTNSQEITA